MISWIQAEIILFFYRGKQEKNGSKFTNYSDIIYNSKSINLAGPLNIRELFIYKVFEKLGIGPEVNFVVNPFVIQDLYIITTDLSNTKSNEIFTTAVNIKAQKDIEIN